MRLTTFNLWHGLSPSSVVAFEELEPRTRRVMREDLQLETLRAAQPDICMFQEVNPVGRRARELASGLGMDYVLQPDLVGLKLLGLGLPYNLNSGLVILARTGLGLRRVSALSLSRPSGGHWVHTWASWQLREERFALFAEVMVPGWGRWLVVNTHLHHGLEITTDFAGQMDALARELELSDTMMVEVQERLRMGNLRRESEIRVLLEEVARLESRYSGVLLGGDFNASPESGVCGLLREAGFADLWASAASGGASTETSGAASAASRAASGASTAGFTFDKTRNRGNHELQSRFPLTLVLEDLTCSATIKERLLALARAQEARERRIDYLWFKPNAERVPKFSTAELLGVPIDDKALAPSDHFGVLVEDSGDGTH